MKRKYTKIVLTQITPIDEVLLSTRVNRKKKAIIPKKCIHSGFDVRNLWRSQFIRWDRKPNISQRNMPDNAFVVSKVPEKLIILIFSR